MVNLVFYIRLKSSFCVSNSTCSWTFIRFQMRENVKTLNAWKILLKILIISFRINANNQKYAQSTFQSYTNYNNYFKYFYTVLNGRNVCVNFSSSFLLCTQWFSYPLELFTRVEMQSHREGRPIDPNQNIGQGQNRTYERPVQIELLRNLGVVVTIRVHQHA